MASAHQYLPTLNKTGFTTTYIDAVCRRALEFAANLPDSKHASNDFSAHAHLPVLDIGCAYGLLSLPLLAQGNHVIANDVEQKHLDILRDSVPQFQRKRLTLLCGKFPDEVPLEKNSLSCVVSSWVFHFFSPEILVRSAHLIFEALAFEGKLFLSVSSPYLKFLSKFIVVYEKQKMRGDSYPGWMPDVAKFLEPSQVASLPASMHFLDPEVLKRVFEEAGFKVEWSDYFHREDCTEGMFLDGRENVGLVAHKSK